MKKLLKVGGKLLSVSALALAMGLTQAQAGSELTIKASHAASTTNTGHKALELMDRELRERTDGRISIEIFPNGQLGGERELIESIQLGNIDLIFVSSAPLASFNKQFFALDMPFLFKDRASVYKVLDGEIGQELLQSLNRVGLSGLGYWENGFRQLTNNSRVIRTSDDLKGLRMRTMENEIHLMAWRELGTNPAPLAFSELYTALQQGTFEAQEGPINLFRDMRFDEVQKHISITNHIYSPFVVLMNPELQARLSKKDQAIFTEIFQEAKAYQRGLAQKADSEASAQLKGVTITSLTAEELNTFSSKMKPVYDKIKKIVGADLADRIVKAAQ
ncbi:TRAP transporter substrate-binding protein [Marinospirillum minutulum]|uniref:TRAP transporter substrate-binding protein n=1 Tax=Marinospirillum minutulum TaxID=64974 RepID=UPI000401D20D|nr:TRAP transporter substrate-binding protein [Marinospirillum minutulum]